MGNESPMRRVTDRSRSGAPAAGSAVRDFFSGDEIFQRLIATADEEFSRSNRLLFLSGIAAGLSIGLSFLARAAVSANVPGEAATMIGNILYPVGFLLIVLGRYQLFTENTLTPITLVLTRIASLPTLFRVWGIVLAANLLGAGLFAFILANTGVLSPEAAELARGFGEHALEMPWGTLFWKAIFAGFIVASMVWLTHAARDSVTRFFIVFALMFLIPSTDLFHCIIGACEVLYLVFQDLTSLWPAFYGFFLPVVLGNTVGGVVLVGILNFAQTREHRFPNRDCRQLELSWREWLFGTYTGRPIGLGSRSDEIELPPDSGNHDLAVDVQSDDHVQGDHSAPLSLMMYGDFECPHARAAVQVIREAQKQFGDDLCFAYRHYPLSRIHPHAQLAAQAAEAAANQGAFWAMFDELYAHQDALTRQDILRYAERLELDLNKFKADLESDDVQRRVATDLKSGRASGVQGTPTLFVDGYRYRDDITLGAVRQMGVYFGANAETSDKLREVVRGGV